MSKRFLVIDDDSDDRELFSEALASVDPVIVCDQATDGAEALKRLTAREIAAPDIIFLDINMPVMNGWQFAAAIQEDRVLGSVPVVIVTAYAEQAREIRANAVVKKPVNLDELLAILKKYSDKEAA